MATSDQGNSPRKPTPVTPTTTEQAGDAATDAQIAAVVGATEGSGPSAGDPATATDANQANATIDDLIEVRVLRDHGDHKANTVASLTEAEVKAGEGDWLDAHPDAVAYVRGLSA